MPLSPVLFPIMKIRRRFYSRVRLKEVEDMSLDFYPRKKVDESPAIKGAHLGVGWRGGLGGSQAPYSQKAT